MANICGHCKSSETQALFDTHQCLECGEHTDMLGRPVVWKREGELSSLHREARGWEVVASKAPPGPKDKSKKGK